MNRAVPCCIAFTLAALAGCAEKPPEVPLAPPPPVYVAEECDAQAVQSILGQAYTNPLGEDARVRSRAERVRALRPGDMVTMEFNARRLTIDVNAEGKVTRVRCG
jgi:hypothetical protein